MALLRIWSRIAAKVGGPMPIQLSRIAALALCLAFASVSAMKDGAAQSTAQQTMPASACDYACLTAYLDQYLSALVAHDPARLPLSPRVRFTENTIPMKLGDALWGTISVMVTYKIYFADPHAGEAGCEVTIREKGTPAILVVRLKVVAKKITEVETIVRRGAEPAE